MKYRQAVLALVVIGLLASANAMGFFKAFEVTLFSSMQGVITSGDKAVVGATIKREAIPNNDKVYSDSTISDENGRFEFSPMRTSMLLKALSKNTVVTQKVVIESEGKEYLAWYNENFHGVENQELNEAGDIASGKLIPIDLNCDLSNEESDKAGAYTMVISGICSWQGQKDLD